VPTSLPLAIAPHLRGSWAGRLDDLMDGGQLSGWACAVAPSDHQAPAQVRLVVEDLLPPAQSWPMAEVAANRYRPELELEGRSAQCGFLVEGPLPLPLPVRGTGSVLRAFVLTPDGEVELSGSPQRLNPQRYRQLEALGRQGAARVGGAGGAGGPGAAGGLHPLEGPWVHGWGPQAQELSLLIDGTIRERLQCDGQGRFHLALPAQVCDGGPHHLELLDGGGISLDARLELAPFELTPWPALLEHGHPPFPDQLNPLVREQHRSLTTWLHWADAAGAPLPPDLPRLHHLLVAAGADVPPTSPLGVPMALPTSEEPRVSVVIPAHNHYGVTRRCLLALAYAPTRVPFEVIVVDDGSSDGTTEALARDVEGCRLVRHGQATGFNQACHSGVGLARGEYVVLLNNDTQPCCLWLEELLEPFYRWPATGLVGAQLIFPNGRLQESGGIVWGEGQPWNYGRGGNPYDPKVSYTRQVDYVSGAALAMPLALWHQVGGFSPEFAPAYFEDTDLAFKVRAIGLEVRCAPLARVVHHEGTTSGVDTTDAQSVKRLQLDHAPLFRDKWHHALLPSGEPSREEAERLKDRGIIGRALVLDHAPPQPDRDAGSQAALNEMGLLLSLGWKVTFLPANLAWLGAYSEELQRSGIESIHAPFVLSVEQFLRARGREFELIYITRYTTVRDHIAAIKDQAPKAKLLFCNADLHYLRELRQVLVAGLEGGAHERALEAVASTRREELEAMAQVDLTLSYSALERSLIETDSLGRAATSPCPWVVETVREAAPLAGREGLAFLGSYRHPPNVDAIGAFLLDVWPLVHRRYPALVLHLYGSGLNLEQAQAWADHAGVRVEGWVADTAPIYDRHRVFIAPLRCGAGLKGKVVEALARGIPQVLSPVAAEGTELRHGDEVLIAETPAEWLEQLSALLDSDDLWQRMSMAALAHGRSRYGRERGLALMARALRQVGLPVRGEG